VTALDGGVLLEHLILLTVSPIFIAVALQ